MVLRRQHSESATEISMGSPICPTAEITFSKLDVAETDQHGIPEPNNLWGKFPPNTFSAHQAKCSPTFKGIPSVFISIKLHLFLPRISFGEPSMVSSP